MQYIKMSALSKEQIKKFARDNCLSQDEIDLFSKLVDCIEVQ
jgi:hypothetical protein